MVQVMVCRRKMVVLAGVRVGTIRPLPLQLKHLQVVLQVMVMLVVNNRLAHIREWPEVVVLLQ
jgi:hypothetical protein